jgi:3-methyl-2-oxobutanoate hydroxymethyltransferase
MEKDEDGAARGSGARRFLNRRPGAIMGVDPGTPRWRFETTNRSTAMNAMTQHTSAQAPNALYGGKSSRRITVRDIAAAKQRGEKWPMLTAYDAMTASVFDQAGIPVMLVGDSMGNCHLGYDSTVPVTLDEMTMLSAAVVRGTRRALIVGDLPFGSYQEGPAQALRSATRLVKEAGVGAVKLEGGERSADQVRLLVESGIPVMAHVGYTPQSVNAFGGHPVQGRGEEAAQQLLRDAKAVQNAGAFAVVLELVKAELAAEVTRSLHIPTVGIGAGAECDAQVLVWTDMAGMTEWPGGKAPRFVKEYARLRDTLGEAARSFAEDVVGGTYPADRHSFH